MGKIKDAIIKRLGGHTEEEWKNRLLAPPRYEVVTQFDVETIGAHVKFFRYEVDMLGSRKASEIAKKQLISKISGCLEPYVEVKEVVPTPPYFDLEMVAELRVVNPKVGRLKTYG